MLPHAIEKKLRCINIWLTNIKFVFFYDLSFKTNLLNKHINLQPSDTSERWWRWQDRKQNDETRGIWARKTVAFAPSPEWEPSIPGEENKMHPAYVLLLFFFFKHGLHYCRFIIKAACFITEHKHYSWALCTIFSKPIRAWWRGPAHPRKDGIFTFQCHVRWILIWLPRFNVLPRYQFHASA